MFDFLTSTKRPAADAKVLPAAEVLKRVKALNRTNQPWHIIDGASEGVDLIAEWKIVDARWYELFAKASLQKVFRIFLKLDDTRKHVRAQDREYEIAWRAGVPTMSAAAKGFRGQKWSVEYEKSYGITEDLSIGEQYKYLFKTSEIKAPIQNAVVDCGWVYKGVVWGTP